LLVSLLVLAGLGVEVVGGADPVADLAETEIFRLALVAGEDLHAAPRTAFDHHILAAPVDVVRPNPNRMVLLTLLFVFVSPAAFRARLRVFLYNGFGARGADPAA